MNISSSIFNYGGSLCCYIDVYRYKLNIKNGSTCLVTCDGAP